MSLLHPSSFPSPTRSPPLRVCICFTLELLRIVKRVCGLWVESNKPDCVWRANKPNLLLPQQTQLAPLATNPTCSSLNIPNLLLPPVIFLSYPPFSLSLCLFLSLQCMLLLPLVRRATTHYNTLQHIKQMVVAPGWHMWHMCHMAYVSTSHTCVYVDEV